MPWRPLHGKLWDRCHAVASADVVRMRVEVWGDLAPALALWLFCPFRSKGWFQPCTKRLSPVLEFVYLMKRMLESVICSGETQPRNETITRPPSDIT